MGTHATRDTGAALARLDTAAQSAGLAMVCAHESSQELHKSLVRQYLSSHPLRHPLAYATVIGLRRDQP
jgi:hypothetical protein